MIPVDRAQVGMVLASGITDRRGRLLIPAGKELSERYLECLPMWGVTHVDIEGEEPGAAEEGGEAAEPWAVNRAMEETGELFVLTNRSHPAMEELEAICIQRRAREIQREKTA